MNNHHQINEYGFSDNLAEPSSRAKQAVKQNESINEVVASTNRNYINWSGSNNEHSTYAGYLKKQGALFKQWKERYFVLDSVKHQLRYYDHFQDSVAKGVVDLSDVECINQGLSASYMQQNQLGSKALNSLMSGASFSNDPACNDPKNCFELKTSKRLYTFCAKSPQEAYKWVKQLEMCCLDS